MDKVTHSSGIINFIKVSYYLLFKVSCWLKDFIKVGNAVFVTFSISSILEQFEIDISIDFEIKISSDIQIIECLSTNMGSSIFN